MKDFFSHIVKQLNKKTTPEKNTNNNRQNLLKHGQNVAFLAAVLTSMISLLKLLTGLKYNSHILIADAIHSISDCILILSSGISLLIINREKSEKFPFGLYRIETIVSFAIGVFIIYAGADTFFFGIERTFINERTAHSSFYCILVTIISIAVTTYIVRIEYKAGSKINSISLMSNAKESMLDISISLIVLTGIILNSLGIPYIEGFAILVISSFIIKLGVETSVESFLNLVDIDKTGKEMKEIILNRAKTIPEVNDIKIISRQSGPFKFVYCRIYTYQKIKSRRVKEIKEKTESIIRNVIKNIESVFLSLEISHNVPTLIAIPVENVDGLGSHVNRNFHKAPYICFVCLEKDRIELEFVPNFRTTDTSAAGLKNTRKIIDRGTDVLCTGIIGEIPFFSFIDNSIDIYLIQNGETVEQVLENYKKGTLLNILKPTHLFEDHLKKSGKHIFYKNKES